MTLKCNRNYWIKTTSNPINRSEVIYPDKKPLCFLIYSYIRSNRTARILFLTLTVKKTGWNFSLNVLDVPRRWRNIVDHKAVNSSRNDIFTSHIISFGVLLSPELRVRSERNMGSWHSHKHLISSQLLSTLYDLLSDGNTVDKKVLYLPLNRVLQ